VPSAGTRQNQFSYDTCYDFELRQVTGSVGEAPGSDIYFNEGDSQSAQYRRPALNALRP